MSGVFSLFIIVWAIFSIIIGLQESDFSGFIVGLIFLLMGIAIQVYLIKSYKKTMYMEMVVDSAFEEGLYTKLEPVLSSIAEVGVNVADIEKRMDQISFKIEDIITQKEAQTGAHQGNFIIKSIFVLNLTLGVIIFLSINPLAGIHFILTAVYLAWWFLITSEFKLYNNAKAWYFCFGIIIFIPMSTVILNAFFNLRVMMAILFIGIAIFALFYYAWCTHTTRGEFPFNLHKDLKYGILEIQKKKL